MQNGLPCQDDSVAQTLREKKDIALCVISDGAGSAKYAAEGAKMVTELAISYFEKQLLDHPNPEELISDYDKSDGEALADHIRTQLTEVAVSRNSSVDDFSATLLACIVHPKKSFFIQLGDGCWCVSKNGVLGAVTWPSQGEFVGQTYFVTMPNGNGAMQTAHISGLPDYICGISDGLERLALDLSNAIPHDRFFRPLARKLNQAPNTEEFETDLKTFLESARVCERTDDDKSIVIVIANGSHV